MGYDVHITRSVLWMKTAEDPIPLGQWMTTITEDIELTLDTANGPYSARWNQQGSSETGWFDWKDGNIYTTNPSRAAIAKMLAMADCLSARVQGDDGEVYEYEYDWSSPQH